MTSSTMTTPPGAQELPGLWEFDEQPHPPYRGVVRCLFCDDSFEHGYHYMDHLPCGGEP